MKKTALEVEIIAKAQAKIDFTGRCIMRIMQDEDLSDISKQSIVYDYYEHAEEYIAGMAETYWIIARENGTYNQDVYDKLRKYSFLMVSARLSKK